MSTSQYHNCVVGNAICSGARKVAWSVGQALSSFAMPLWICAVVLLSVSLPVHGASVFTGADDTTNDNVMAQPYASDTTSLSASRSNNCKSHNCIFSLNKRNNLASSECDGCRLFATTNMLYDAAMTPNIGVGIGIGDRVVLLADWMYARWSNHDRRRYWRIYGGDVEARYRIGARVKGSPLGGHYVGVYGSIACYDFQAGRSHTGVLSDTYNYAAGVSYTYSLPVSTHFNIDFNLGVGYLWGRYKKCTTIDDCDVWMSTHRLGWFGPTRAGVTLVWLIGNRVKNSRKGGAR